MTRACGEEVAPRGAGRGDGVPGTRWVRQSSDARVAVDLLEVVCADVPLELDVALGRIPLVRVRQV